jgi:hypothetical protein
MDTTDAGLLYEFWSGYILKKYYQEEDDDFPSTESQKRRLAMDVSVTCGVG